MRFMVIIKANNDSEAGVMPSTEQITAMMKYNEQLARAGVLLAAEGLHASSKGSRVKLSGTNRTVTDGPFTETKELVAGFWLLELKSKEEALEWVKRVPNIWGFDTEIEVRQVIGPEDFGEAATTELKDMEARLRADNVKNTVLF